MRRSTSAALTNEVNSVRSAGRTTSGVRQSTAEWSTTRERFCSSHFGRSATVAAVPDCALPLPPGPSVVDSVAQDTDAEARKSTKSRALSGSGAELPTDRTPLVVADELSE